MIEFAKLVPDELLGRSGSVFYSGRAAFSGQAPVYVLGMNPGGDPVAMATETVRIHVDLAFSRKREEWSEYRDEPWGRRSAGAAPLQLRVVHLLFGLRLNPRFVPASNLIFVRARRAAALADIDALVELCWPLHEAVLATLRPRAIICLGVDVGNRVRKRLNANKHIDSFMEQNRRRWQSHAWEAPTGLLVFSLAHPAVANWRNDQTDPTRMILDVLQGL